MKEIIILILAISYYLAVLLAWIYVVFIWGFSGWWSIAFLIPLSLNIKYRK